MRSRRLAVAVSIALLAMAGCGSDDSSDDTAEPVESEVAAETDAPAQTDAPVETDEPVETDALVLTDEAPPPFVLLGVDDPQHIKGYVMPNGRILWVDETSGVGRIIANPDEVLADQATCEYLFGMDTDDWFDWAEDIPNFEGPVCHPYSVNEGL